MSSSFANTRVSHAWAAGALLLLALVLITFICVWRTSISQGALAAITDDGQVAVAAVNNRLFRWRGNQERANSVDVLLLAASVSAIRGAGDGNVYVGCRDGKVLRVGANGRYSSCNVQLPSAVSDLDILDNLLAISFGGACQLVDVTMNAPGLTVNFGVDRVDSITIDIDGRSVWAISGHRCFHASGPTLSAVEEIMDARFLSGRLDRVLRTANGMALAMTEGHHRESVSLVKLPITDTPCEFPRSPFGWGAIKVIEPGRRGFIMSHDAVYEFDFARCNCVLRRLGREGATNFAVSSNGMMLLVTYPSRAEVIDMRRGFVESFNLQ